MKTKYNAVLKVRKQQLDKAEMNLSKAKQRQKECEQTLLEAKNEYLSLNLPQKGGAQMLKQGLEFIHIAREKVKEATEKFALSQKEVMHYQSLYKKANMDYEKVKYLHNEALKKMAQELKKTEEKFIDEIAVSRFFHGEKDD